jgi:hydroxyacylglutathione hydrolase
MTVEYLTLPVTPFQQNCNLLWETASRKALVLDPGGDMDIILERIERLKLHVEGILLTHGHLDHVGAAEALAHHFQVPVMGPQRQDQFLFQSLPVQAEMFGFPSIAAFQPDSWLEHGQLLRLGEERLELRHCPGHTPGHLVVVNHNQRLVFTGDVLFRGSIGRSDFPRGDHQQLLESIARELLSLDDSYRIVPGHGPESTIGQERRENPFLR